MTQPTVSDATTRFSVRVADYVKYRPGYPTELVGWLRDRIGLAPDWLVADVGAGTGISARPFLDAGCHVIGVEPNREMRDAMVTLLAGRPNFRAADGTAEATGLPDRSADLVVCAQSFHWFDVDRARAEFRRILRDRRVARPDRPLDDGKAGWVALIWNDRTRRDPGFAQDYDAVLRRWGIDYEKVRHDPRTASGPFSTTTSPKPTAPTTRTSISTACADASCPPPTPRSPLTPTTSR